MDENQHKMWINVLSVVLFSLLLIGIFGWYAYVFGWLWLWFVVPLGLPELTWWHALGLIIMPILLVGRVQRDHEPKMTFNEAMKVMVIRPLLFWGIGYLAHLGIKGM